MVFKEFWKLYDLINIEYFHGEFVENEYFDCFRLPPTAGLHDFSHRLGSLDRLQELIQPNLPGLVGEGTGKSRESRQIKFWFTLALTYT